LYLTTVIDLHTRRVLGYSLSERMLDDLEQQAFLNAWSASSVGPGMLLHSESWQSVRQRRLRQDAGRIWLRVEYESQRRLLGQRSCR
jgi:transposase InsO family protein